MPGFFSRNRLTATRQLFHIGMAATSAVTLYQRCVTPRQLPHVPPAEGPIIELCVAVVTQLSMAYHLGDRGLIQGSIFWGASSVLRTGGMLAGLTATNVVIPWGLEILCQLTPALAVLADMVLPAIPEQPQAAPVVNNAQAAPVVNNAQAAPVVNNPEFAPVVNKFQNRPVAR